MVIPARRLPELPRHGIVFEREREIEQNPPLARSRDFRHQCHRCAFSEGRGAKFAFSLFHQSCLETERRHHRLLPGGFLPLLVGLELVTQQTRC